jgi:hypothetical protein
MKKVMFIFIVMMLVGIVCAEELCDIDISILNQDPYPAVPGDIVKVVFMLDSIDSSECGTINFEILDGYPFTVMPYDETVYVIRSGTYTSDYSSYKTIPVDVRVDPNAIDGSNPFEIRYKTSANIAFASEKFDVEVQDVKVDFEVFVSDYNYATKELKFEILNIGKSDVEAVTVDVLDMDGVKVYGSNRENIGDLSSNEDTSADFKADIYGDKIKLRISYSDTIQERRVIEKDVDFNSQLFESTKAGSDVAYWQWILGIAIIVVIFYFYRKSKKKKK